MNGNSNPLVELKTEEGDITMRVFADIAPISSGNFLAYVDGGHLDGQTVFRIVTLDNDEATRTHSIEALHWGWQPSATDPDQPFPNIPLETTRLTGLTHKRGTLSMARYEPGNSGSSFFFCMQDDPEFDFGGKRQPDGQGFAAFGEVISGFDTMDRLFARAEKQPYLEKRIPIHTARRIG